MPTNPTVPLEVAEAKGKGPGSVLMLGVALAIIGFLAVLVMMRTPSSPRPDPASAATTAPAQLVPPLPEVAREASNYPICPDARDVAVTEEKPVGVIRLRENCWSGRLSGFPEAAIARRDDRDIEFLLEDGSRKLYYGPEKIQTTNAFAWARARGTGDLKLWIPGFASMLPSGQVEAVPTEGVVKYVKRGGFMEVGKLTIEPASGGERTYVVGVFTMVYRPGHSRDYIEGVRVGDYVRLTLARGDRGSGMFVQRIEVLDEVHTRARPSESPRVAVDGNFGSSSDPGDTDAIALLAEGTVTKTWPDGLRLRVNGTGEELEVTNARDVPVYYRGDTYRIANLELGDEVRVSYFPASEESRGGATISRPVKVEVLRSASR